MTPERYALIKKVFLRAVEVEKKDLKLLLDAECGSDMELRREVETLLQFHVEEPESDWVRAAVSHPERGYPKKKL